MQLILRAAADKVYPEEADRHVYYMSGKYTGTHISLVIPGNVLLKTGAKFGIC
jgi:hypothetical protein